jgi:hypothetical protein
MELTEAVRIVREQTIPALRAMWRDWYPVHVAALETVLVALEQAQAQANVALLDAVRVRSELREMGDERDALLMDFAAFRATALETSNHMHDVIRERDALRVDLAQARSGWAAAGALLEATRAERDALRDKLSSVTEDYIKERNAATAAEAERDALRVEVAAAKDGQIEALRENVDLRAEVGRSQPAILALTAEAALRAIPHAEQWADVVAIIDDALRDTAPAEEGKP